MVVLVEELGSEEQLAQSPEPIPRLNAQFTSTLVHNSYYATRDLTSRGDCIGTNLHAILNESIQNIYDSHEENRPELPYDAGDSTAARVIITTPGTVNNRTRNVSRSRAPRSRSHPRNSSRNRTRSGSRSRNNRTFGVSQATPTNIIIQPAQVNNATNVAGDPSTPRITITSPTNGNNRRRNASRPHAPRSRSHSRNSSRNRTRSGSRSRNNRILNVSQASSTNIIIQSPSGNATNVAGDPSTPRITITSPTNGNNRRRNASRPRAPRSRSHSRNSSRNRTRSGSRSRNNTTLDVSQASSTNIIIQSPSGNATNVAGDPSTPRITITSPANANNRTCNASRSRAPRSRSHSRNSSRNRTRSGSRSGNNTTLDVSQASSTNIIIQSPSGNATNVAGDPSTPRITITSPTNANNRTRNASRSRAPRSRSHSRNSSRNRTRSGSRSGNNTTLDVSQASSTNIIIQSPSGNATNVAGGPSTPRITITPPTNGNNRTRNASRSRAPRSRSHSRNSSRNRTRSGSRSGNNTTLDVSQASSTNIIIQSPSGNATNVAGNPSTPRITITRPTNRNNRTRNASRSRAQRSRSHSRNASRNRSRMGPRSRISPPDIADEVISISSSDNSTPNLIDLSSDLQNDSRYDHSYEESYDNSTEYSENYAPPVVHIVAEPSEIIIQSPSGNASRNINGSNSNLLNEARYDYSDEASEDTNSGYTHGRANSNLLNDARFDYPDEESDDNNSDYEFVISFPSGNESRNLSPGLRALNQTRDMRSTPLPVTPSRNNDTTYDESDLSDPYAFEYTLSENHQISPAGNNSRAQSPAARSRSRSPAARSPLHSPNRTPPRSPNRTVSVEIISPHTPYRPSVQDHRPQSPASDLLNDTRFDYPDEESDDNNSYSEFVISFPSGNESRNLSPGLRALNQTRDMHSTPLPVTPSRNNDRIYDDSDLSDPYAFEYTLTENHQISPAGNVSRAQSSAARSRSRSPAARSPLHSPNRTPPRTPNRTVSVEIISPHTPYRPCVQDHRAQLPASDLLNDTRFDYSDEESDDNNSYSEFVISFPSGNESRNLSPGLRALNQTRDMHSTPLPVTPSRNNDTTYDESDLSDPYAFEYTLSETHQISSAGNVSRAQSPAAGNRSRSPGARSPLYSPNRTPPRTPNRTVSVEIFSPHTPQSPYPLQNAQSPAADLLNDARYDFPDDESDDNNSDSEFIISYDELDLSNPYAFEYTLTENHQIPPAGNVPQAQSPASVNITVSVPEIQPPAARNTQRSPSPQRPPSARRSAGPAPASRLRPPCQFGRAARPSQAVRQRSPVCAPEPVCEPQPQPTPPRTRQIRARVAQRIQDAVRPPRTRQGAVCPPNSPQARQMAGPSGIGRMAQRAAPESRFRSSTRVGRAAGPSQTTRQRNTVCPPQIQRQSAQASGIRRMAQPGSSSSINIRVGVPRTQSSAASSTQGLPPTQRAPPVRRSAQPQSRGGRAAGPSQVAQARRGVVCPPESARERNAPVANQRPRASGIRRLAQPGSSSSINIRVGVPRTQSSAASSTQGLPPTQRAPPVRRSAQPQSRGGRAARPSQVAQARRGVVCPPESVRERNAPVANQRPRASGIRRLAQPGSSSSINIRVGVPRTQSSAASSTQGLPPTQRAPPVRRSAQPQSRGGRAAGPSQVAQARRGVVCPPESVRERNAPVANQRPRASGIRRLAQPGSSSSINIRVGVPRTQSSAASSTQGLPPTQRAPSVRRSAQPQSRGGRAAGPSEVAQARRGVVCPPESVRERNAPVTNQRPRACGIGRMAQPPAQSGANRQRPPSHISRRRSPASDCPRQSGANRPPQCKK